MLGYRGYTGIPWVCAGEQRACQGLGLVLGYHGRVSGFRACAGVPGSALATGSEVGAPWSMEASSCCSAPGVQVVAGGPSAPDAREERGPHHPCLLWGPS